MNRTEAREGVRMMKFLSILSRYEAAEFSQLEAAELLGVGERTFRRWRQRYEEDGEAGLMDRRLARFPASACRRIGRRRSRRFIGVATVASRQSIFTSTW